MLPFNNSQAITELFARQGDEIAALLVEPVLGNSGMIPATMEFMQTVRDLCYQHGVCLIADEIVTGFRMLPGPLCRAYRIRPDILILGKALSGGLPFACLLFDQEWAVHARRESGRSCMIDLGTFNSHPATFQVVLATLRTLLARSDDTYRDLCVSMERIQSRILASSARHAIPVAFPPKVPGIGLPFPIATLRLGENSVASDGSSLWSDAHGEVLRQLARVGLALDDVFVWQGLGALSTAHREADIDHVAKAYDLFLGQIGTCFRGRT